MPSPLEEKFQLEEGNVIDEILCADMSSKLAVVVTHPWGVLGGNAHNNVVVAATLFFQKVGITTVRFDFSGTQIGRGFVQVEQVKRVSRAVLSGKCICPHRNPKEEPPQHILFVGYSYGSLISASASADIPECIGVVSVAPPFAVQHWLLMFHHNHHLKLSLQKTNLPRLLVLGSNDNFTSEANFREIVEERYPIEYTTGAVLKGADHFFSCRERDLMDIIAEWLLSTFPQCRGNLKKLKGLDDFSPVSPTSSTTSA